MNVLYFTKDKKYTNKVLQFMLSQGVNIIGVVVTKLENILDTELEKICHQNKIPFYSNESIYLAIRNNDICDIDLLVSFMFGNLIRKPVLELCHGQAINLHPAPLPEYRGMFVYNHAIYNKVTEWGVTCHYISDSFDTGNIIEQSKLFIDKDTITLKHLESVSSQAGALLLEKVIKKFITLDTIDSTPQSVGHYYDRNDFELLKCVSFDMSENEISRRIKACWFPPYEGAYIEIDGKRFILLESQVLESWYD